MHDFSTVPVPRQYARSDYAATCYRNGVADAYANTFDPDRFRHRGHVLEAYFAGRLEGERLRLGVERFVSSVSASLVSDSPE